MGESSWKGWTAGAANSNRTGIKYIDVCAESVKNDTVYKNFKNIQAYSDVVTGQSRQQGYDYIQKILKSNSQLLEDDNLLKIIKGDEVGNPKVFEYDQVNKKISATLLRYTSVLSELIDNFGSLNNLRIVEIGAGYGGQCRVISEFFNFDSYTIIDLNESCELARKYLNNFNVDNVRFLINEDIQNSSNYQYDLAISNYGFSELDKDYQEFYIKNILSKSKMGYITYNAMSCHKKSHLGRHESYDDIEMKEFLKSYKNLQVYNENVTNSECSVFTWGKLKNSDPEYISEWLK